jgi:dTDP-4-amino-4,6-dideoxygalactose transaminase
MKIKFNDLGSQWEQIKEKTLPRLNKCFEKSNFILGDDVKIFEENFSKWNKSKFTVGVANGTDALKISIRSLNLTGNTIFYIPSNTYIATLLGVVHSMTEQFEYRLIDCDEFFQIDLDLLEKELIKNNDNFENSVVMPVHLYGSCCDMKKLLNLREKYNFYIVEDCSQSHGTLGWDGKKVGNYGDIAAFSLYPGKNLGACGDAGCIVTNNKILYERCLKLRNLGSIEKYVHDVIGWNSRLDTLQSIILDEKLKLLDEWNEKRNYVAKEYNERINNKNISLPKTPHYCEYNTFHIYPILTNKRSDLIEYLQKHEIPTIIHYPIPIELTGAFFDDNINNKNTITFSKNILSLPIHPFMCQEEIDYIVEVINNY